MHRESGGAKGRGGPGRPGGDPGTVGPGGRARSGSGGRTGAGGVDAEVVMRTWPQSCSLSRSPQLPGDAHPSFCLRPAFSLPPIAWRHACLGLPNGAPLLRPRPSIQPLFAPASGLWRQRLLADSLRCGGKRFSVEAFVLGTPNSSSLSL